MKIIGMILLFLLVAYASFGQYYYKDIVGVKETEQLMQVYKNNKVSHVIVNSYDADKTRSDDFEVEQTFSPAALTLQTTTRSGVTDASILTAYVNNEGQVIKTVDSTNYSTSITYYNYNADGLLTTVKSTSTDSAQTMKENEEHIWEYNDGKVARMYRIKNGSDTTTVTFTLDNNGNVVEEQPVHRGIKSEPVYYYYDNKGRLTDIVRYNPKAKRLLADYMFEYSPLNQVIQKITVPATGSDYLIWRYQYNSKGLKVKEAVYNKQKELTGTIEYQYQFSS